MTKRFFFIFASMLVIAGCASSKSEPHATTRPLTAEDLRAQMTLDQIKPVPELSSTTPSPSTQPSDEEAPLDALALYARGVDDLLQSRPFDAVESLQKAIQLDPNSSNLYLALGEAEVERSRGATDRSFDAFEHAAAIRPDNLRIHLLLGRQYMVSGNDDKAILHLRLAQQTTEYRQNYPGAAAVDMLLANELERGGYDRAALDEYLRVARRFSQPGFDGSREPDIGFLSVGPQIVWGQIGGLYEKHGEYDKALMAYEPLARLDPANFQLQANVIRMLVKTGQYDQATLRLSDVVDRFRADSQSMSLMREVTNAIGFDQEIGIFRRLSEKYPGNHAIIFTWADVLISRNKADDAGKLLEDAAAAHPADADIANRLYNFYVSRNETAAAAGCLVRWLAADPDAVREIDPLFYEVSRPIRQNPLRLATLQKLQTPPEAEAAKLYLVSRMADRWQRDAAARSSIEAAVKIKPPFAPAFRIQVVNIWARPDLSQDQKIQKCRELAVTARAAGNPSLASEIRGLSLMAHEQFTPASEAFAQAIKLGGNSPDLQLSYAATLQSIGKTLQCEQTLWKLVAQRPHYDEAWDTLYGFYVSADREADAARVLQQWRQADPGSAQARLHQAIYDIHNNDMQAADQELSSVLEDHNDDSSVLLTVSLIYVRINRVDDLMTKLQALLQRQPNNMTIVETMVQVYSQTGRVDDAAKLLDDARKNVSNDPDSLYQLAALYHQIDHMRTWEELLTQVLKIDPTNVPASNDLGFAWADAGKNLDSAEKMIRLAVDAEPDNQAFLDSLGWVLYKRSEFTEAEQYFKQAIGPAASPDPEILDHYGDDLYRLGRRVEAEQQWQRALLGFQNRAMGDEDARLLGEIQRKLSAAARGQPAAVAPAAVESQTK